MKRQVYVIEGRRKGSTRKADWVPLATDVYEQPEFVLRRYARKFPTEDVRVTTYVPKDSK